MTTWTTFPEVPRVAREVLNSYPEPDRLTLARCAVLPLFDDEEFAAVLRTDEAADVQRLVELGAVDMLPGGDAKFRVATGIREAAWSSWFDEHTEPGVPQDLRSFAELLAAHCTARSLVVDRVRALVLVDNHLAELAFSEDFDACAERMDLAGCHNLLDVLADPMLRPFIGKRLVGLRNERSRALNAREVLRTTFLGSSRYLHRPVIEANLELLLADTGPRALRLEGSGGHGKSTMLKWFISRRCVPDGIPCAFLDLDAVDPVNATKYPFLVALEIAYQLNGQMDGAPFEELLREHGSYRSLLAKQPGEAGGANSAALGTVTAEVDAEEVQYRFLSVLRDVSQGDAVLVVLDTFEEAALRPAGDADALVEVLADLHDGHDSVRLVVSGRRTRAEDEITVFARRMPADVMPLREVRAFSPRESREYLTSTRGMTQEDLVPQIVARAGGVPWQLALYADVVEQYPQITAEVLRTLDPGVAWAVDRVVGRIGNDVVQWLIRYGAVPRYLSRDFAEKVLLPRIVRSMAGSEDDRPSLDPIPPDAVPVFRTGPEGDLPFDQLWDLLTRYAASKSWMWIAPNDDDAVEFHPAVREPMRRLVAAQPISGLLHQDAVAYYERLALSDARSWARWTGEALYHHFRLDGVGAAPHWYAAVEHAWQEGRPEWVASVADEVLGPDYLNDEAEPVEVRPGLPAVDTDLLVAAHAERAWALSVIARANRLPGGHSMWSRVEMSVSAAQRLPADVDVRFRLAGAMAALLIARGDPAGAAHLLQGIESAVMAPTERLPLMLLLADALGASGDPAGARNALLNALADVPPKAGGPATEIVRQLAMHDLAAGQVDQAAHWVAQAVGADPHPEDDLELMWLRARVEAESGRPARALAFADNSGMVLQQVDSLIALGRPAEAADRCSKALGGPTELGRRADLLVRRALAYGDLFDVDRALEDLLQARAIFFQLSDTEGAGTTCAYAARVQLRVVGNLRDAEHLLEEADRLRLQPGAAAWVRVMLLRAELHHRRGDHADALRVATEVLDTVGSDAHPCLISDTALAALAFAPQLEERAMAALAANLPRITPASARLTALPSLELAPASAWGARLRDLVHGEVAEDRIGGRTDAAWLDFREAELARVADEPDRAVELATGAAVVLARSSTFAWWRLMHLAHRAGRRPGRHEPFWETDFPLLTAAYALLDAGLWMDQASLEDTELLLDRAGQALAEGTQRVSRWRWALLDLRRRLAERRGMAGMVAYYAPRADAVLLDLGQLVQSTIADLAPEDHRARPEVRLQAWIDPTGALVLSSGARELIRLDSDHDLVAALRDESDRRAKSPVVRWVRDAARERTLLEVGDSLPGIDETEPVDLRITADPPLAQLPWELVTFGGRFLSELPGIRVVYRSQGALYGDQVRARVLQEALAEADKEFDPGPLDGYLGPETRRAITLLQYRSGLTVDGVAGPLTWHALRERSIARRAPHVVVVQRHFAAELSATRGYSQVGGEDLHSLYARSGWQTRLLEGHDLRRIDEVVPAGPVDVLHVNASMDVSGSVPYLDFGASPLGWSQERPDVVPVSDLDHAVYQLSLRGHTPLVVLDVAAAPHFTSETVRQLLLRNDFAHQLLTLGRVASVLATGLATEDYAAVAQRELVKALGTAAVTPDEVVRRLQRRSTDDTRRTALFTALRPDLMPRITPDR
jgi:peptidoglycan hydrolase-like protein with peptidoglycan-binding domain/tetratricopeptide (TPR) repeat protein